MLLYHSKVQPRIRYITRYSYRKALIFRNSAATIKQTYFLMWKITFSFFPLLNRLFIVNRILQYFPINKGTNSKKAITRTSFNLKRISLWKQFSKKMVPSTKLKIFVILVQYQKLRISIKQVISVMERSFVKNFLWRIKFSENSVKKTISWHDFYRGNVKSKLIFS